ALVAADSVLIPLEADKFSVYGLNRLLMLIEETRGLNGRLEVEGLLISLFKHRRVIQRAFDEALRTYPGVHVLDIRVKESALYQEATNAGMPITHYRPMSDQAHTFRRLANTVAGSRLANQPPTVATAYAANN